MKKMHSREQFNSATQRLVGLTLQDVIYYELEYGDTDEPAYFCDFQATHRLDYGLELISTGGQRHSIIWDDTFFQFGLGLYPHSAIVLRPKARQWHVDQDELWSPFIGHTITSVLVYWSWVDTFIEDRKLKRSYYPQDITLSFSCGGCIFISASRYDIDTSEIHGMSDEVLVVFNEAVACNFQIGPYRKAI